VTEEQHRAEKENDIEKARSQLMAVEAETEIQTQKLDAGSVYVLLFRFHCLSNLNASSV